MKKALLLSLAFAVILLTNCRKSNVQPLGGSETSGETIDVVLDAGTGTGDDKTTIDGYSVSWVAGDKIHVVGQLDGYLGYMTAQSSGNPVKFKGTIKKTTSAQNYLFYYVGDNDFTLSGDNVYTFSVASQHGSLSGNANSITNKLQLMKGSIYVSGTPGAELGAVTLNCMMSIIRLNLKTNGTSMTSGAVTVSGGYSSVKINTKTGEYVGSSPLTSGNITLNNASGSYYMAVITGNQTSSGTSQTLTFASSGCQTSFTATIAANKFYNKDSAKVVNMVTVLPGVLSGEFTVGPNSGNKVCFSQGNLYYDGTVDNRWEFEASQYDFRTYNGKGSCINGTYSSTTGTPASDWGLFGWSTVSTTYGMSTSTSSGSYTGAYVDWGGNTIYAGGVATTGWRTLRKTEMDTLLNLRSAANRYAKAKVKGVIGLVLFPDVYTGATSGTGLAAVNTSDAAFPGESIPAAVWTNMESAGAVFLPAAGNREGTGVGNVGSYGRYWSSTNGNDFEGSAYYMHFSSDDMNTTRNNRYFGFCVRLVR